MALRSLRRGAASACLALLVATLPACGDDAGRGDAPADPSAQAPLPATPAANPLDVVLIVIDTQRADRLGCYGFPLDTSPEIDAYAAAGVRIVDVTSQSSWTAPSMVSLMLSRHVADNFVRMPPPYTLAERLRAAGYRTAAFVDNILLAKGTGFDRGFDVYELEPGPKIIMPVLQSDDPRPLFAYFHFVDPHDPYKPFPQFDLFKPEPLPEWMLAGLAAAARLARPDADATDIDAEVAAAASEMSAARARYAGDVHQADQRVRFVREALAASGRSDKALVVIAADHGECLWEHREAEELLTAEKRANLLTSFKMTHNSVLYEELTRVPLIFSGGGLPRGLVLPGPAQNVDIVPTILDLLGLRIPETLEGHSLLHEVAAHAGAGATPDPKDAGRAQAQPVLLRANTAVFTSVRDGEGWKLIVPWDTTRGDRIQLFDLKRDPHEQHPIDVPPADPAARAAAERLTLAVQEYRRSGLQAESAEDVIDAETRERMQQLGYLGR